MDLIQLVFVSSFLLLESVLFAFGCGRIYRATNLYGEIKSPNFPSAPSPATACTWEIQIAKGHTFELNFTAFEISDLSTDKKCIANYVEIDIDGKSNVYCNEKIPKPIRVEASVIIIKLEYYTSIPMKGFSSKFQVTRTKIKSTSSIAKKTLSSTSTVKEESPIIKSIETILTTTEMLSCPTPSTFTSTSVAATTAIPEFTTSSSSTLITATTTNIYNFSKTLTTVIAHFLLNSTSEVIPSSINSIPYAAEKTVDLDVLLITENIAANTDVLKKDSSTILQIRPSTSTEVLRNDRTRNMILLEISSPTKTINEISEIQINSRTEISIKKSPTCIINPSQSTTLFRDAIFTNNARLKLLKTISFTPSLASSKHVRKRLTTKIDQLYFKSSIVSTSTTTMTKLPSSSSSSSSVITNILLNSTFEVVPSSISSTSYAAKKTVHSEAPSITENISATPTKTIDTTVFIPTISCNGRNEDCNNDVTKNISNTTMIIVWMGVVICISLLFIIVEALLYKRRKGCTYKFWGLLETVHSKRFRKRKIGDISEVYMREITNEIGKNPYTPPVQ